MVLAWFIMFLAGREAVQFIASPRYYFRSGENFLELLLLLCSSTVVCNTGMSPLAERHLAGVTVLLLWTELIMMTGKLPFLSLQLEMLKKVVINYNFDLTGVLLQLHFCDQWMVYKQNVHYTVYLWKQYQLYGASWIISCSNCSLKF